MLIGIILKALGGPVKVFSKRERTALQQKLLSRPSYGTQRLESPKPKTTGGPKDVTVKPYPRRGRMVGGYTRHMDYKIHEKFTPRIGRLVTDNWERLKRWATISANAQIAKGNHFNSMDDAIMAGIEEGARALTRYNQRHGPLENFVRPSIKYGILKHLAWERSKGITGTRTLYDMIHAAGTDEEREEILKRMPQITEVPATLGTGDIEDSFEAAYALMHRDELLDIIERELHINLKEVRDKIKRKEKTRKTWKTVSHAKRKIKTYLMKTLDQMSFREIAAEQGIAVGKVFKDFQEVGELIRKVRAAAQGAVPQLAKKALSQHALEAQFALNWQRLQHAIKEGYPKEYVEFIIDRLAMLYAKLVPIDLDEEEKEGLNGSEN